VGQALPQHFIDNCNQLWASFASVEPDPEKRLQAVVNYLYSKYGGTHNLSHDNASLANYVAAMQKRMAQTREQGFDVWYTKQVTDENLCDMFVGHIMSTKETSILDIGCMAMMLWVRNVEPATLARAATPVKNKVPFAWILMGPSPMVLFSKEQVDAWSGYGFEIKEVFEEPQCVNFASTGFQEDVSYMVEAFERLNSRMTATRELLHRCGIEVSK